MTLCACAGTVEAPLEEIDTGRVVEMQTGLRNAATAAATYLSEQGSYRGYGGRLSAGLRIHLGRRDHVRVGDGGGRFVLRGTETRSAAR